MSKNKSVMEVMRYGTFREFTCVLGKDLDAIEEFAQAQKAAIQVAKGGLDLAAFEIERLDKELTLAKAERDSYQRVGIGTMEKLVKAQELLNEFPSTGWVAKRDAFLASPPALAAKEEPCHVKS